MHTTQRAWVPINYLMCQKEEVKQTHMGGSTTNYTGEMPNVLKPYFFGQPSKSTKKALFRLEFFPWRSLLLC